MADCRENVESARQVPLGGGGHAAPGAAERAEAAAAAGDAAPLRCSAILTHHWLVRHRGGEKVLEALRELLPDAPIYTLLFDPAGTQERWRDVHPSWVNSLPGVRRHYPRLLPLLILAARTTRLPEADLVVCSDAALAKAMPPHRRSRLICYCHSPMRYAWDAELREQYAQALPAPLRAAFRAAAALARRVDARAAQRVDRFVANSRFVAERIRRFYGREAHVVYPPVELPSAPSHAPREDFYLFVGHNTPYKRLDLALAACRRLGRPLVVIGDGYEQGAAAGLRRGQEGPAASACVRYLGYQRDATVADYYRRARGLLFPGVEDFGLVPVEAIAHGCPVIAYAAGGACETVLDGRTGVLFDQPSADGLAGAMLRAEALHFEPAQMLASVQRFSRARFLDEMRSVLETELRSS